MTAGFRPLSAEEKADLAVHMQVPEVCETRAIPYFLEVRIDGAKLAADTIHGAGAREDRPVIVFREIPVAVGERAIDVAFRPLVQARDHDRDDDGDDEDDDGDAAVSLAYSERLTLGSREVALVIFDPARRALVRVEHT